MGKHSLSLTLAVLAAVLTGAVQPAAAEVALTTELTYRIHCPLTDGTPHPKRLDAVKPILDDGAGEFDTWTMIAGYVSQPVFEEGAAVEPAAKGKRLVVETFQTKADGSRQKLAKFKTRPQDDGSSSGTRTVTARLEKGDLLEWRLHVKGGGRLAAGECFFTLVGYTQGSDSFIAPALGALTPDAG